MRPPGPGSEEPVAGGHYKPGGTMPRSTSLVVGSIILLSSPGISPAATVHAINSGTVAYQTPARVYVQPVGEVIQSNCFNTTTYLEFRRGFVDFVIPHL